MTYDPENVEKIENAIIDFGWISIEHGVLTATLQLRRGKGTIMSFGGFSLYHPEREFLNTNKPEPNYTGHFIYQVLRVVGVEAWDDLKCKAVRIAEDGGRVVGLGNMIKEEWFFPERDFGRVWDSR